MPWSLSFGGLEQQARTYVSRLKSELDIDFVSPQAFSDFDLLHVVGVSVETARPGVYAKRKGKRLVVSPIMYRSENLLLLKCAEAVCRRLPVLNWFGLNRQALDAADAILPNSQAEADQLRFLFRLPARKITVIRNGVDPRLFDGVDRDLFPQTYGASDFVLSCAMIDPRKNTLALVRGFLESGIDGPLVVIGGARPFDVKYAEQVIHLMEENRDRVIRVGALPPGSPLLLSAYLNARVFALPSFLETPGLSTLEAGLAGCQLVLGECPPVREYLGDRAHYCDPRSTSSIADALKKACRSGPADRVSSFIRERYGWDRVVADLLQVYRRYE